MRVAFLCVLLLVGILCHSSYANAKKIKKITFRPIYPWPGGVVPYLLDHTLTQKEAQLVVKEMKAMETDTCVTFKKRSRRREGEKILHVFPSNNGSEAD